MLSQLHEKAKAKVNLAIRTLLYFWSPERSHFNKEWEQSLNKHYDSMSKENKTKRQTIFNLMLGWSQLENHTA